MKFSRKYHISIPKTRTGKYNISYNYIFTKYSDHPQQR